MREGNGEKYGAKTAGRWMKEKWKGRERIENERSGGENQKNCRANKAHLLLLREDGREIGWMKEVWTRSETMEKERAGE
jgi:hypothetical protein